MAGFAYSFSAIVIFLFVTGNFLFPCNRIFPLGLCRNVELRVCVVKINFTVDKLNFRSPDNVGDWGNLVLLYKKGVL